MNSPFKLGKFTLIITTRCNLRCKLCCEYVPQHRPFPDMTLDECRTILSAFFDTVDHVRTLHLSGGGEPFLHPALAELVEACIAYRTQFDRLMLFTNGTVTPSPRVYEVLNRYGDSITVQVSRYGIKPDREKEILTALEKTGVTLKVEKYYDDDQSFGGWVDFGAWEPQHRSARQLSDVFHHCAVTRDMHGNWRTRDGKVHWCSRSQRGMELGTLPDYASDYVDLFDNSDRDAKREKFQQIANGHYLQACDYCSGDQGTTDQSKRFRAAEQEGVKA